MREFVPFPWRTLKMFLCSLIGAANSINIRLRVSNPHGLLLWTGGRRDLPNTPDHLLLGIDRGYLQVQPQSPRTSGQEGAGTCPTLLIICSLALTEDTYRYSLSPHRLLLWTGGRRDLPNTPDYLLLGIDRGYLQVQPQSPRASSLDRRLQ